MSWIPRSEEELKSLVTKVGGELAVSFDVSWDESKKRPKISGCQCVGYRVSENLFNALMDALYDTAGQAVRRKQIRIIGISSTRNDRGAYYCMADIVHESERIVGAVAVLVHCSTPENAREQARLLHHALETGR